MNESNIHKLNSEQKELCEGNITYDEIKEVIRNIKNNKTPGSDGLPVEFWKKFWVNIGHFLIRSYNESFEKGELSFTQKQGVITCLPKDNKPREFLKNWRPISLLNTDYKILTGVLALRMKKVLPDIIEQTQKGFLKERFIGENTRLVYDIMDYLNKTNKAGLLLLVDFEKAFDTLEWPYLKTVLKQYNFGDDFIQWYDIIYNNSTSCVINNGVISEFFKLGRGCRQGDPLSPYLFILSIEPLAKYIQNNKDIKGIIVEQDEFKIGQYADDTFCLLDGTEKCFGHFKKIKIKNQY